MSQAWIPGAAGPHEELVTRIHQRVEQFLSERPAGQAVVEVELKDGPRVALESIGAEPGFGFVTLRPHPEEEEVGGEEWIVPVERIAGITLREADAELERFGFALPER
jgi:hypothetical protein